MTRPTAEIRAEIARCERLLREAKTSTRAVVLTTRIDALKWAASRTYTSDLTP